MRPEVRQVVGAYSRFDVRKAIPWSRMRDAYDYDCCD
jgi:hypothetical protein